MTPRRPSPAEEPPAPQQIAILAILGAVFLVGGLLHEVLSRPIVPVGAIAGMVIFALALGLGAALLASKSRLAGRAMLTLSAVFLGWYVAQNEASLLAIGLLGGAYFLGRAGVLTQALYS